MRRNLVKVLMLVMLIALCIWQIALLWLGDMSSHNFLVKKDAIQNVILVQPKAMWVNTGGIAYKIDDSKNEYNMLINELRSFVVKGVKNSEIDKDTDKEYEELLSMPGILYEYDLNLGLQELIGNRVADVPNNIAVSQIFVDMSEYTDNKTSLYLVTEDAQNIYKATFYNRLEGHQKIMERFNNPEVTQNLMGYQPSATSNQKQNIAGNNFLPLNTKEAPIEYKVLQVTNPIEENAGAEKINILEQYVNSFFDNPLLKEIDEKGDGSVIFSENMRAIVKYEPAGTLEFNYTSANQETKLTSIERLTKVMAFIRGCTGIPTFLKERIYLTQIVNQGEESIYKFDYKYKGFSMQLSDAIKDKLGLDHILEITIKNNQVIRGKWSVLKIEEDARTNYGTAKVSRGFREIVDEMYEVYIKNKDANSPLEAVQCQYVMDTTNGEMNLKWVVLYQNKWYYP